LDATFEPVNRLDSSSAARVIERDYPLLRDDLANLTPDRLLVYDANDPERSSGASIGPAYRPLVTDRPMEAWYHPSIA
jgi:hypothetical protein